MIRKAFEKPPPMDTMTKLKSDDSTEIYCIGDNINLLKFEVGPMNWSTIPVSTDKLSGEAFNGLLRYPSCVFIPPMPDERIIVSGGCSITNGFPTS